MKKTIGYTISSVILLNSFQLAMASPETDLAKEVIDKTLGEKEIIELLRNADTKTTEELVAALKEVRGLMDKISEIQAVDEADKILRYATHIQLITVAAQAMIMRSHVNSTESNNLILALGTVSMAINTFITHYKKNKKVDSDVLSKIVFDTSRQLSKDRKLSPEIQQITASLNTISSTLLDNQGEIANLLTNVSGSTAQDIALAISFTYLIIHVAYPKVAKEADGFLKDVLPKIEKALEQSNSATKKTVAIGGTGTTAATDIIGAAIGMTSEDSKKLILRTMINLDSAANKLQAEINLRKAVK